MRWLGALALALTATAGTAQRPANPAEQYVVYVCGSSANLAETRTLLTLEKGFFEDGTVAFMSVTWEDHGGGPIQRLPRSARAMVTLHWPGDRDSAAEGPLDWSTGTISVMVFGGVGAQFYQPRPRERWRQVFVDRDRSRRILSSEGTRYFHLSRPSISMAGELNALSTPPGLDMSLDLFLLWGSGVRALTVYETLVAHQPGPRRSETNNPPGLRRIVAEYDVDVAAIARIAAQVREAAIVWENSIGDYRTGCQRRMDGGNVIVT